MAAGPILLVNKFLHYSGGVEHVIDRYSDCVRSLGVETVVVGQQLESSATPARFTSDASRVVEIPVVDPADSKDAFRFMERALRGIDARRAVQSIVDELRPSLAIAFNVYHQIGFSFLRPLVAAGVPTVLSAHDYKVVCTNYLLFDHATNTECRDCLRTPNSYLVSPLRRRCVKGSRVRSGMLVAESIAQRARGTYERLFDRIVFLNELQCESAVARGVSRRRIRMLPNAVESLDSQSARPSQGEALYVGRLSPEKGVRVAIEAAAQLQQPLRIVGDGPQRVELERLARDISAPVEFEGWLSHEESLEFMRGAGVLLLPSICPDVFPLTVVEAMALGVPVVASAIGGSVDLLSDGRGILVTPGDARELAKAVKQLSHVDTTEMVVRAQRYAHDELSPSRWHSRLVEILGELVPQLRGGAES